MNNEQAVLSLSLLHPPETKLEEKTVPLDKTTYTDLGIERILKPLVIDEKRKFVVTGPASSICLSKDVIDYRLDILEDLMDNKALLHCMKDLLPRISALRFYLLHPGKWDVTPLQETVWRIRELKHYVNCMESFSEAFKEGSATLSSEGLLLFRNIVRQAVEDPGFQQLREEIPKFLNKINRIKSVKIGINLNDGLLPFEAVLLGVSDTPYRESGFLGKMIRTADDSHGGRFHSVAGTEFESNPLMIPLFKDLSDALNKSMKPLQRSLKNYGRINGLLFVNLFDQFLFYLGAVNLIETMEQRGLPMVRPRILDDGDKRTELKGMYNLDLVLQSDGPVVPNDWSVTREHNLFILTGPNSGGKTTFLQAAGIIQYLAQVGLYVPAEHAELSLYDNIFTHYPSPESDSKGVGRLGEEAERIKEVVSKSTGKSLILLNESLSTTNSGEACYLAQDLLKVFAALGCTVIFVTHLHQLAQDRQTILDDVNMNDKIVSLVAQVDTKEKERAEPSFRVITGPPDGKSFAMEMARQYGISREQLMELI